MTGIPLGYLSLYEASRKLEERQDEIFGPLETDAKARHTSLLCDPFAFLFFQIDLWENLRRHPDEIEAVRRKNKRDSLLHKAIRAGDLVICYEASNGNIKRIQLHSLEEQKWLESLWESETGSRGFRSVFIPECAGATMLTEERTFHDWMNVAMAPDTQANAMKPTVSRPAARPELIEKWMMDHIKTCEAQARTRNQNEIYDDVKNAFPRLNVNRQLVRKLHKQLVPHHWGARGPKPKSK